MFWFLTQWFFILTDKRLTLFFSCMIVLLFWHFLFTSNFAVSFTFRPNKGNYKWRSFNQQRHFFLKKYPLIEKSCCRLKSQIYSVKVRLSCDTLTQQIIWWRRNRRCSVKSQPNCQFFTLFDVRFSKKLFLGVFDDIFLQLISPIEIGIFKQNEYFTLMFKDFHNIFNTC